MPSSTLIRISHTQHDALADRRRVANEGPFGLDADNAAFVRAHPLSTVRGLATGLLICAPLWLLIWTGIAWLT